ncbi:MAG: hypothetical protein PHP59_06200 [Methanofollis sp.]|uniref:hypothetical protein n=1 Tax=Methanofollis sp. TaxID=2052835 RepID=UPI0026356C08|nr:hypothetical protein [Methanofollis sp.]MDD4254954.1 hypothetical protein [Methanofollis sp.]
MDTKGGEADALWTRTEEAIREAEADRQKLLAPHRVHTIENVVLVGSILLCLILLLLLPAFHLFWIVASFLLYMVHPFVMFIPSGGTGARPKKEDILAYTRILKDIGAIKDSVRANTSGIAEIFWNLFFVNSQPLTPGFILIYAVDILVALILFIRGEFTMKLAALISLQAIAIIAFYGVIWGMKPYSPGFFKKLINLHHDLKTEFGGGAWTILPVLLIIGAGAAFSGTIIIAAMLLPGMTFGRLMDVEEITILGTLLPVVPILLAQFVIVRSLQGRYSRVLLETMIADQIRVLKEDILPKTEEDREISPEARESLGREVTALRAYRPDTHHIGGYFRVYMIVPNIRLIFERKSEESGTSRLKERGA